MVKWWASAERAKVYLLQGQDAAQVVHSQEEPKSWGGCDGEDQAQTTHFLRQALLSYKAQDKTT